MYTISRCLNGFFFAVPREDAPEETEAGEHEALEDQAELEGIPRAQSFLGDHVEGTQTDGECFLNFIRSLTLLILITTFLIQYNIQILQRSKNCAKVSGECVRNIIYDF